MGTNAFVRKTIGLAAISCWMLPSSVVGQNNATNETLAPAISPGDENITVVPTSSPLFGNQTSQPTVTPTSTPSVINGTVTPTFSPTLNPGFVFPDCYDNTTVLFQAMLRANSFIEETYIICPNTTIEVGIFDADGDCCIEGDMSLFLRSRSTVMCGVDGKSSNNCVLRRGNTQVFYVGSFFGDALAQDVRVIGMTFEDAEFLGAAMANRGDVTFIDCIWKNQAASGVLFVAYSVPTDSGGGARRLLEEDGIDVDDHMAVAWHVMTRKFQEKWVRQVIEDAEKARALPRSWEDGHNRELQAAFTMQTNIVDNLFLENRQGDTSLGGIPLLGIIAILTPFNPTNVRNSRFVRNIYDGSDGNQNGFALQSLGAPVEVTDCCFEDNSFIGFGPIQAFASAPFTYSNNHVTDDDLIFCDFGAVSTSFTPESFADISCIYYDLVECGSDELRDFPAPTASPTSGSAESLQRVGTASALVAWLCTWLLAIHNM